MLDFNKTFNHFCSGHEVYFDPQTSRIRFDKEDHTLAFEVEIVDVFSLRGLVKTIYYFVRGHFDDLMEKDNLILFLNINSIVERYGLPFNQVKKKLSMGDKLETIMNFVPPEGWRKINQGSFARVKEFRETIYTIGKEFGKDSTGVLNELIPNNPARKKKLCVQFRKSFYKNDQFIRDEFIRTYLNKQGRRCGIQPPPKVLLENSIIIEKYYDKDLSDLVKSYELQPIENYLIIYQLLCGLAFAHEKRVTHGKIEPDNILIVEKKGFYHAHIANWGEEPTSESFDIFGLGTTCYSLLTKETFRADSGTKKFSLLGNRNIPAMLATLIKSMLSSIEKTRPNAISLLDIFLTKFIDLLPIKEEFYALAQKHLGKTIHHSACANHFVAH